MDSSTSGNKLAGILKVVSMTLVLALVVGLGALSVQSAQPDDAYAAFSTAKVKAKAKHPKSYPIIYKLNGGKQAKGQKAKIAYAKKLSVKKLKKPTRADFTFVGWYKNKKLTKRASAIKGSPRAAKRTLYAKWKPKTYKIVYKLGGGTNKKSQVKTIKGGKKIATSKLKKPTRTGYTFAGWYANKKLTKKASAIQGKAAKSKRTLYAKWKAKKYAITYELNGGKIAGPYAKTYKVTETVTYPTPSRSGYEFVGWYTNDGLTTQSAPTTKGQLGDKTLYAKWTPIDFSVSYVLNGGTMPEEFPTTYNAEQAIDELPVPAKSGYAFMGWYSNAKLTTIVPSIGTDARGNKTLYAKWRKRVLVAHRGLTASAPENSVQAFQDAAARGFEEVEFDVRFTADGAPVLVHNATVKIRVPNEDGTTTTTKLEVAALTYEQLQTAQFAQEQSGIDGNNLATFEEGIAACDDCGLRATIHLKTTALSEIATLMQTVEDYGMQENVRWATSDIEALRYIRSVDAKASLFYHHTFTKAAILDALALAETGDVMISLKHSAITASKLALCKKVGLAAATWDFADETEIAGQDQYLSYFLVDDLAAETVPTDVEV